MHLLQRIPIFQIKNKTILYSIIIILYYYVLCVMCSGDGHYRTSTHFSGLDLKSVKATFKRLAKKKRVLQEVNKKKVTQEIQEYKSYWLCIYRFNIESVQQSLGL